MGLFDDMAKAVKEESVKPDGWITMRDFIEMSGGKLCRSSAQEMMQAKVRSGQVEVRKWINPETKRRVNIYKEI